MMQDGFGMMNPIVFLLFALVVAVPGWRICAKAGYPGWLGLLIVVPIANVVLLYFLGFSEWPIGRSAASSSAD